MDNQKYRITYKIGDKIKFVIVESKNIRKIVENVDMGYQRFVYINDDLMLNPDIILKIENQSE